MSEIPNHLKYTREHEWVSFEPDGTALMGITDFAQSELGDIVYVELPQPGQKLTQMETFGTIEAVKTVSDLYAPLSGEVLEVNPELTDDPTRINESPYGDGWLLKIRPSDPAETSQLLGAQQYRDQIGQAG
jgi:glycine cleavage system H protein